MWVSRHARDTHAAIELILTKKHFIEVLLLSLLRGSDTEREGARVREGTRESSRERVCGCA